MFPNNGYISKNGAKRDIYDHDSVRKRTNYNHFFNGNSNEKGVETKILMWVLTGTGLASYVAAILLNLGTWKSDLLFFIAILFGIVRFIRYTIKTWQEYRKEEIEIRILKRKEIEETRHKQKSH